MNRQQTMQEFFDWLFDKNVNLKNEIDLSLCSKYEDPYIYFPEELYNIFQSSAMKRLGRVSQLATAIRTLPNVYHTRLEHSIGVYNCKLELILEKWKDTEWKRYIEENDLKLNLVSELIKSATHDIGHLPLSHVMEILIMNSRGFHEEIGKRIVLEDKELQEIFYNINPRLSKILKTTYDKDLFGMKAHDESNYDVDRLDYLQRDSLYEGNPFYLNQENYSTINVKIDESGNIAHNTDGSINIAKSNDKNVKKIDIYENTSLKNIEEFLSIRMKQYENIYFSEEVQTSDYCIGMFINELLKNDVAEGKDLANFIHNIKSVSVENINIEEYVKWDDIRFWKNTIDVAENSTNPKLQQLALLIIPDLKSLMNLTFQFLNCKKAKQTGYDNYSEEDKNFIYKIHSFIYEYSPISQVLKNKDFFQNNIMQFSQGDKEEIERILGNELIEHSATVTGYNMNEPLYIKDKLGRIFELSNHPERSKDWKNSNETINVLFCILPLIEKDKKEKLSKYRTNTHISNTTKVNMSQVQTQNTLEEYFEL